MLDMEFFKNIKIFVTGHTGFKGAWLCKMLINSGADVTGYSLNPQTIPNLYDLCEIGNHMNSVIGDIRDLATLEKAFNETKPEIVFHLAAQPIVRESYKEPLYTYETNIMGTVNILECIRKNDCVKSFLNVTTDKVYQNREWEWGYRENEPLEGFDPYSNSKSCSELITHSYKNSFFADGKTAISTARAGNVIGGGDFAKDRIIPDCVRAIIEGSDIAIRNPYSTRPYQHVLESICAYLMISQKQHADSKYAGYYNVGPDECDCIKTGELVDIFCRLWGNKLNWINESNDGPHEANFLKLDCSKLKNVFNWKSRWNIEKAVEKTIEWTKVYINNGNISNVMDKQIKEFLYK
jgi:CDP-glucose 4,6-dehydratase